MARLSSADMKKQTKTQTSEQAHTGAVKRE